MDRRNFVKSSLAAFAAFCIPAMAVSDPQTVVEDTIAAEDMVTSSNHPYFFDNIKVGTLLFIDMELVRVTKVFHTDTGPVFAYVKFHA